MLQKMGGAMIKLFKMAATLPCRISYWSKMWSTSS